MKLRTQGVAALALSLAVTATGNWASAQSRSTSVYKNAPRVAQANKQVPTPSNQPMGMSSAPASAAPMEDAMPMPGGYADGPHGDCYSENGCYDGCDTCYTGCGSSGGGFLGMGDGRCFVTADYLNVHASFSEATAYVREDLNAGSDQYIPLEFDYNSSWRVGAGWKSCCCGDQIRFMYTQMTSDATDTAQPGDIVPNEAAPPPGGRTDIRANVDARTLDLECAKTIPLGGLCCGCGDACGDGCCGTCGNCCPAWDITWSGGVRWADVGWQQSFVARDTDEFPVTDARVGLNFRGGGLRTGLEGRRYFFKDGWLSIYAKGDISLLLGDVNVSNIRDVNDPSQSVNPVATNTQTFRTRQIIPVTELECGLTGQVSNRTAITAGYLFAAWHDLGIRPTHELNTLQPITYDDANILGFDGFFARLQFDF
ncbi:MAG: Lpg1974 family pore-forming outer membrane protein [Pirellulales bacterium]